jgi:hypothetical protein
MAPTTPQARRTPKSARTSGSTRKSVGGKKSVPSSTTATATPGTPSRSRQAGTPKSYRFRPGTRALQEIRRYQKSYDFLLPKLPFARVVREAYTLSLLLLRAVID